MLAAPTIALSMRLLVRSQVGRDSWGQPLLDDEAVGVKGYFYQLGSEDADRSGTVTLDTGKVLIFADSIEARPHEWQAVELDILGETQRWEIIGKPEAKHSLARGGQVHHWEMLVSRAAA